MVTATEIDMSQISDTKEVQLARLGRAEAAGGTTTTGVASGMTGTMSSMLSTAAQSVMSQNLIPVANPQQFRGMKLDPRTMGGQTFAELGEKIGAGDRPAAMTGSDSGRGPGEGSSPSPGWDPTDANKQGTDGMPGYSMGSDDDADITAAGTAQTNATPYQKMMGSQFVKDVVPMSGLMKGGLMGIVNSAMSGNWGDMLSGLAKGILDISPLGMAKRAYDVASTAYQGGQVTGIMGEFFGDDFDPNQATPEQVAAMKSGMDNRSSGGFLGGLLSGNDKTKSAIEERIGAYGPQQPGTDVVPGTNTQPMSSEPTPNDSVQNMAANMRDSDPDGSVSRGGTNYSGIQNDWEGINRDISSSSGGRSDGGWGGQSGGHGGGFGGAGEGGGIGGR